MCISFSFNWALRIFNTYKFYNARKRQSFLFYSNWLKRIFEWSVTSQYTHATNGISMLLIPKLRDWNFNWLIHNSSKVTFSFKQTFLIYKLVDSRFSSVAVVLDVDVGNFRSVRVDDLGHERGVPRFAVVHGEPGRHAHLGLLQTVPVQFDLWNVVVWLDFGC